MLFRLDFMLPRFLLGLDSGIISVLDILEVDTKSSRGSILCLNPDSSLLGITAPYSQKPPVFPKHSFNFIAAITIWTAQCREGTKYIGLSNLSFPAAFVKTSTSPSRASTSKFLPPGPP